jgi:hypothetical protein
VEALGAELARLDGALDQAIRRPYVGHSAGGFWNPSSVLSALLEWLDELRGSVRADDLGLGRRFEGGVASLSAFLDRCWQRVEARDVGHDPAEGLAPGGARARRRSPGHSRA